MAGLSPPSVGPRHWAKHIHTPCINRMVVGCIFYVLIKLFSSMIIGKMLLISRPIPCRIDLPFVLCLHAKKLKVPSLCVAISSFHFL